MGGYSDHVWNYADMKVCGYAECIQKLTVVLFGSSCWFHVAGSLSCCFGGSIFTSSIVKWRDGTISGMTTSVPHLYCNPHFKYLSLHALYLSMLSLLASTSSSRSSFILVMMVWYVAWKKIEMKFLFKILKLKNTVWYAGGSILTSISKLLCWICVGCVGWIGSFLGSVTRSISGGTVEA